MRRDVPISLYYIFYKKSEEHIEFLCLISQGPCTDVCHTQLPCQEMVGSSQDIGIIPLKTFTHLYLVVILILTAGSSNLNEFEDLHKEALFSLHHGFSMCDPWTSSISIIWEFVRNANFQTSLRMCWIRNSGEGLRNLCFNTPFRLTFENFCIKPSFQQLFV